MRGWKTAAVNAATILLIVTDYLTGATGLLGTLFSTPKDAAVVTMLVAIVNLLLRHYTDGPPGWKKGGKDESADR